MEKLDLYNDLSLLPLLADWVEKLSGEMGLPAPRAFNLHLALEEAVVNVMKYAYPGESGKPVRLSAEMNGEGCDFLIEDEGIGFDPTAEAAPDVTLGVEERPIGGLGIFLVKNIMDEVRYERESGKNRLYLKFKKQ